MLASSTDSLSDKAAAAQIAGFGGLVGYLSVGYFAAWVAMSARLRRSTGRWTPATRPSPAALLLDSLRIGLAYTQVIHAMRTLPAAEGDAGVVGGVSRVCPLAPARGGNGCDLFRLALLGCGAGDRGLSVRNDRSYSSRCVATTGRVRNMTVLETDVAHALANSRTTPSMRLPGYQLVLSPTPNLGRSTPHQFAIGGVCQLLARENDQEPAPVKLYIFPRSSTSALTWSSLS